MSMINSRSSQTVVVVSGGFDPFHVGHLRHFIAAKKLGDYLVVILNGDNFLKKKKGYVFMPHNERKELIEGLRCVDMVFDSVDRDKTVADTLAIIKPDIFAKGGDRDITNIPEREREICRTFNIKVIGNIGEGGKVQSSSWLAEKVYKKLSKRKTYEENFDNNSSA